MSEVLSTSTTHAVAIKPINRTFDASARDTILASALAHGFPLPHGCRSGLCGSCKAKVLEGEVDHGDSRADVLSDGERERGYALLCQAKPLSPLTIACNVAEAAKDIPIVRLASRVQEMERLAADVMRIRLKIAAKDRIQFLPGQYINIVLSGGIRRSLSIASSPDDDVIELHLRNYGGPFSLHVFNKMKAGDLLRLEGPLGTFFVRDKSAKPMIFLASGTGFAPVKSMIEHELRKGANRSMTLYWGGRRPADLYLNTLAEQWANEHGVAYVPVVSEALPEDTWNGRTGFVHHAVMQDFPDLSGHQVYACGAPIVVQSAKEDFTRTRGLPEEEFFADIFVSHGTPAA